MKKAIFIDAGPMLGERLSGIGHLTLNMVRGLLARKDVLKEYDIKLLAPAAKSYLLDQWQLEGAQVVRVPLLARIWNNLPRVPFAPPIDRFFGKGVYIFPNFKRWSLAKSPSITYVHDISFELFPQFTEPRNLAMLQTNVPRWIAKSNLVITDSQASRDEIIARYTVPNEKIAAIHCGVDQEMFTKMPDNAVQAVRSTYGLTKPYLMFLSSIEPRKNIVRLLQALQQLPDEFKSKYSLLMVGGMGWQNQEIYLELDKAIAAGWDIIKPKQYVPDQDLPALLSGAEALVHPALHEGFGIPVAEAMACGTPVVASDIPVLREVAGEAAIFVDPKDVKLIAFGIEQVLTDSKLQNKLSAAGPRQARQFTWAAATDQLIGYIRNTEQA